MRSVQADMQDDGAVPTWCGRSARRFCISVDALLVQERRLKVCAACVREITSAVTRCYGASLENGSSG